MEKLSALPGVEQVALSSTPPLLTGWQTSFLPEGATEPDPGKMPTTEMNVVTPGYFQTMKTPVLRGRAFEVTDTKDVPPVMIVDQLLADRYFPGQNAVGKRIRMSTGENGEREYRTIVGVVPHLKVYGFEETTVLPQAYLPITQQPQTGLVALLRTSLSPKSFEKPVRDIVASLDPAQPAFEFKTMQERVEETWATPRLMSFLLLCFAGLGAHSCCGRTIRRHGLQRARAVRAKLVCALRSARCRRKSRR